MKTLLIALAIVPSLALAHQPDIQKWEEIKTEKGYILSVDLHYKKDCSKIWTKQVQEFKKMNPKVKDPNILSIGQVIQVQDCRIEEAPAPVVEQKVEEAKPKEKNDQWYVGAAIGASFLAGTSADSEKTGHSLMLKVGQEKDLDKSRTWGWAVGALMNKARTTNDSARDFEVQTRALNVELRTDWKRSETAKHGILLNVVGGEDVSMEETEKNQKLGAYIGVENIQKLNKAWDLEVNLQHRLDNLSRVNGLLNLGLRYNF